jgi:2-polyprenyl-3-methyl-5-hydroxy-6-metoxy-1,4-benzoquinol methylase
MRNTDADWEALAQRDPYWAVLTADEFRENNLTESSRAVFFGNGEATIAHTIQTLQQQFGCPQKFDVALDFGCGVGRLLFPLARRSRIALGVDVASGMLKECGQNALNAGVHNIALLRSDDELLEIQKYSGQVNLLTSLLVFQHIPPSRGLVILNRLLDVLSPTCFGCIQFVTGAATPASEMVDDHPGSVMLMEPYDLNAILHMMHSRASKTVFCNLEDHSGLLGVVVYFQRTGLKT